MPVDEVRRQTHEASRRPWEPGGRGSNDPGKLPGVKHGILTTRFLERNIFCRTGQLILSKIIKIVATSCQILRLKHAKFDFGWDSTPDPAGGAYSAPPNPLVGFNGPPRNVALMIVTLSQGSCPPVIRIS